MFQGRERTSTYWLVGSGAMGVQVSRNGASDSVSSVPWNRPLLKAELFQSSLTAGLLGAHFQGRKWDICGGIRAWRVREVGCGGHRTHLVCKRRWTQYFILGCVQSTTLLLPKRPCLHLPAKRRRGKVQRKLALKEHRKASRVHETMEQGYVPLRVRYSWEQFYHRSLDGSNESTKQRNSLSVRHGVQ